jgi:hypothetical protein
LSVFAPDHQQATHLAQATQTQNSIPISSRSEQRIHQAQGRTKKTDFDALASSELQSGLWGVSCGNYYSDVGIGAVVKMNKESRAIGDYSNYVGGLLDASGATVIVMRAVESEY